MGSKYSNYSSQNQASFRDLNRIHPVWRGVGFAFMILIPIMAYAAMQVFLVQNGIHNWIPIPADILAKPGEFLYRFFPDPMINFKLLVMGSFLFIFYAIFMMISFIISGMFGVTKKRDPFYVPPVTRRPRRRR